MSETSSAASLPRSVMWAALAFSSFQIITAAFSPVSSSVVRALHVGFLLLLIFLLYGRGGRRAAAVSPAGYGLAGAGFALAFYHWLFEGDLIQRAGEMSSADMMVGVITLLLLFEGARRVMGLALPLICLTFLGYALFGEYLPGDLAHRGFGLDQIVGQMAFGTEGIYGTPIYVSSSYIFLFILFGSFLEQAGMTQLFNDVSLGLFGRAQGGPAKVCVASSALMGTINGSGVANVVSSAPFTVPLMKRFGYRPAFAGAVEATSSMGGQIMPPVMGAVAFIMAETLNLPYIDICKAALVPALLYFLACFWMVHLEAGRLRLMGLPDEECPNPWRSLKQRWYLALPLAVLVWLLFSGFTPMFSGMVGLLLTVVLILATPLAQRLPGPLPRVLFWVLLGVLCAGFVELGLGLVFGVIAVLAVMLLTRAGGRDTLQLTRAALVDGAMHALPVGLACALVGIIVGTLTLTGAATSFVGMVVSVGQHSVFASLLLTMLACLVLGMGIPTIPNYIITSAIAAPALLELGVPLIVSHMFVFYFGIMADLTPPVALAAFAAAPFAGVSGNRIGWEAIRIALPGFVVPFMAVYDPALMLQFGADQGWPQALYAITKATLAVGLWGIAAVGYWRYALPVAERVLAFVAAGLLVAALPVTDEAGFALAAAFALWHHYRHRQHAVLQRA